VTHAEAATPPSTGYVDSVLARDEALRRFRTGLRQPAEIAGGMPSRDSLVRRLVRALETRDTLTIERLVIDRAVFAYLYYPSSPMANPPYDLGPGLMWFQLQEGNRKGASRLLRDRSGVPLRYVSHTCAKVDREGDNTVWSRCTVLRRTADGRAVQERLFSSILERRGRAKFLSLANDF
jgi:hypothetical protein